MEIYDTKKEAIEAMQGRCLRLVKVEGGWGADGVARVCYVVKAEGV